MFWTSWFLAVLAIVLAWPVPILLSRAQWPARSPFTAMLLWQAIALAGGLSMIGAMLVYGLEPIGDNLLAGLRALAGMVFNNAPTTELGFWHIFALSAAALLTAHLVFTLLLTYYKIQRQRRRHRELLALLASPSADGPADHGDQRRLPRRVLPARRCPLRHRPFRRADGGPGTGRTPRRPEP